MPAEPPVVVLDDDPTGTQAVHDVPVLLRWDGDRVRQALAGRPGAVHLLTNTRAHTPARAEAVTADAAAAARAGAPGSRIVLRGDSTLRGYVLEEYRAVRGVLGEERPPVLLLVPALPSGGRVTRDGVHLLVRDGVAAALHTTEYASDEPFTYSSARLVDWADERSGGVFAARRGQEVPLAVLREDAGEEHLAQTLEVAWAADGPAVCAPDAESVADLERIAGGLRRAEARGVRCVVRCAPTFAGVLGGTLAAGPPAPPPVGEAGILVVCGSWVPTTSRQLAHLELHRGVAPVELDPVALADPARAADSTAAAATVTAAQLRDAGLAVVATARTRSPAVAGLDAGLRIAEGLAGVVTALDPPPSVVVAKGGITSAVTARVGLRAEAAWAEGPLVPGVALWRISGPERDAALLIVPGNVGDDDLLTRLVALLERSRSVASLELSPAASSGALPEERG